jgi:TusE/DsrC/DsvC family sulfur relay protein
MPKKRKAPKARRQRTVPRAKSKTSSKAKVKSAPSRRPAAASRPGKSSAPQAVTSFAPRTIFDLLHPGATTASGPSFRDAPDGWTPAHANTLAAEAGLALTEDHWEAIRVLQGCYKDELLPRIRLLRDALEARFDERGGMKYLFGIFPGGPIAQGCVFAGLKPPHGARDLSFGSVA